MKKIALSILIASIILIQTSISLAYEDAELMFQKNHLNLANLMIDGDTDLATTRQPIDVIANETYTLILSGAFIGQWVSYIDYEQLGVRNVSSTTYIYYDFQVDAHNELYYVEFTPTANRIMIKNIPADPHSYDIVLIKGTYQDYDGFTPYLHHQTNLSTQKVLYMDYDQRLSIANIRELIVAKSAYGDILPYELTKDTYTPSNQLPGSYHIAFLTTHAFMYHHLNIEIRVVDITPPILSFEGSQLQVPLAQKLTLDEIKAYVEIEDNVDILTTSDLVIISDTYSSAHTIGNYHIQFEISDQSGNTSSLTIPITLVDLMGPVIDGPTHIFIYTEDEPYTTANILSFFNIFDDVDEDNVVTTFTINQYNQSRLPGKYMIQIESKDSQNNKTYKEVFIHVVHNSAPHFELSDLFLEVSAANIMDEAEIIAWFYQQLMASGVQANQIEISFNEYKLNPSQAGEYYVYMTYEVGEEKHTSRLLIHVNEMEKSIINPVYFTFLVPPLLIFVIVIYKRIKK